MKCDALNQIILRSLLKYRKLRKLTDGNSPDFLFSIMQYYNKNLLQNIIYSKKIIVNITKYNITMTKYNITIRLENEK